MIDNLAQEIKTEKDKVRLKELSDKLGTNIILVPGLFKQLGKLEIENQINFGGLEPEILNPIVEMEIWDSADLSIDD